DQLKGLQDKLKDIIEKAQGHVLHHVDWGKRRLAYRVEKFQQAQYLYLQYLDRGVSVAEIERILKYDDRVLKFLTVKLEEKVNQEERLARAGEAPRPPEELQREESSYDRPHPRERHGEGRRGDIAAGAEGPEEDSGIEGSADE